MSLADIADRKKTLDGMGRNRGRDSFVDNLRAVLILFVVLGHIVEPYIPANALARAIYLSIYSFHMPGFVFLAGITSKPEFSFRRQTDLLWSLLLFQLLYSAVLVLTGHPLPGFPYWILWFLLSLFFWRSLLPVVARMTPWIAVSGSTVLSLLIGYVPFMGRAFSLSRTLVFLPFFLAGFFYGKGLLRSFPSNRWIWVPGFLVLVLFFKHMPINQEWLYGASPYRDLVSNTTFAWSIRLALEFLASILIGILVVSTPRMPIFLTTIGPRTLSIYLLHGFLVLTLGRVIRGVDHVTPHLQLLVAIAFTPLVVWITGNRKIHLTLEKVLAFPSRWFFHSEKRT